MSQDLPDQSSGRKESDTGILPVILLNQSWAGSPCHPARRGHHTARRSEARASLNIGPPLEGERELKKLNIHEAKTRLSAILGEVEKGKSFLICRNGKPIADLVPHRKRQRTRSHPVMSKIRIEYDPTEDLTEEEWGEVE